MQAFEYDIPFNTAYTEEYCISGNVSHVLLHYSATQMMEGVNPGVVNKHILYISNDCNLGHTSRNDSDNDVCDGIYSH